MSAGKSRRGFAVKEAGFFFFLGQTRKLFTCRRVPICPIVLWRLPFSTAFRYAQESWPMSWCNVRPANECWCNGLRFSPIQSHHIRNHEENFSTSELSVECCFFVNYLDDNVFVADYLMVPNEHTKCIICIACMEKRVNNNLICYSYW